MNPNGVKHGNSKTDGLPSDCAIVDFDSSNGRVRPTPEPPAVGPRPVKTMVVDGWEDAHVRSFPGKVDASRRVELAFQAPGLLVKLPIKEGQRIAKGELIGQLREDEFQARLTALSGQLDRARAALQAARAGERPEERMRRESEVRATRSRLANARTEYQRLARLLPSRAISRAEYDQAETLFEVAQEEHEAALQMLEKGMVARVEDIQAAEGEVRGLEGQVVEAEIRLADCTLRAPFDGVIAKRFVEEGQNVQAKQPIVRFQDIDEVEIIVDVPESVMLMDLRTADIISLTARLGSVPGREFPLEIREIAQAADPVTQTFQVRVIMEAPTDIQLLPGMTATVTASYRRASVLGNRVLVPVSALVKTASGEQVAWVIGPDNTVARRPVEVGTVGGGQIEITAGLEPGERIAVAGANFLREGMRVTDLGDCAGSHNTMNPGVFSVRNDRIVYTAMALLLLGGVAAYISIGRLEDPEFTIKEALIITPYPGASAEEVAQEVTNPIETAVQQLGQLDYVESESVRGRSLVSAFIKDRYDRDRIPQVWDELRRKIADVQAAAAPVGAGQVDGGGRFRRRLRHLLRHHAATATRCRRSAATRSSSAASCCSAPGVKSIELFGAQQEVVFLEISRHRLAQLGINEEEIYRKLQDRNIAADGGRVRVGDQHIPFDPNGEFGSAEEMLDLVIGSDKSGRQLFLRDVATLSRGDQDPPRRLLRYDGQPAIGLGISTIQGGTSSPWARRSARSSPRSNRIRPIGIEIGEINFQPEAVSEATNEFMFNLVKAVSIVFVVLLIAMGRKTGLIIGVVLFLTIMATFFVMYLDGDILMERISLGALIIALCMLTDNAIIVIEGIKVGIESGRDKLEVVREAVGENQWPLFGATAIGVIAFAAIGLSEHSTGEYIQLALLGDPDRAEPQLGVVDHHHARC